ncbi:hypothetical protein KUL25_17620 [Rhodobacteraceae bacterium N5(2021)]|uniref:Uncharacterized protein n=1 Tax=Gymnodinialimonas phycosphaerae TaxID=2841589 RepID=A0A975TU35_9RHOB|nr:hypothetical protein [Gymnodinialimonas phycosphaerae]MBY4894581.1 hypothetical protein [Gymnodinialimonas phycosphaerae]
MRYLAILSILILTACGVDGEPERPERAAPVAGLSISGTAEIGISGSL